MFAPRKLLRSPRGGPGGFPLALTLSRKIGPYHQNLPVLSRAWSLNVSPPHEGDFAADCPILLLFEPSRRPLRVTLWQAGSQGVPAIHAILHAPLDLTRATLLDRAGGGIEYFHKADRAAGFALGGHDDIVLGPQLAEREPRAAPCLVYKCLVADRGKNVAQVVA